MPHEKFDRDAFLKQVDDMINDALTPQPLPTPLPDALKAFIQRRKPFSLKLPKIGV